MLNTQCRLVVFIFKMKSILLFLVFCLSYFSALAQDANDGGIPNAEIVITKDRQIVLPKADRNFDKIPPRQAESVKHDLSYQLKNISFTSPEYSPIIRPLKLKEQEIAKLFGNYVAAGFGNYASPYLEGFINSKRDRNKAYGAHFFHNSFGSGAVDKGNSASGRTEVALDGKYIGQIASITAIATYEKNSGNFYGYTPQKDIRKDTIEQHYARLGFDFVIDGVKKSSLNYQVKAGYGSLGDNFSARESEFYAISDFQYKLSDPKRIRLGFEYFLMNREDEKISSYARHLVKVKPNYEFSPIDKLVLTVGANVALQNDPTINLSSVNFFPSIKANYELSKGTLAYGLMTGDIDKVSLKTVSDENFWINSNQRITNTNRSVEFVFGLKGKLANKVAFHSGLSFANLKGYYFYQSNFKNRAKFDLNYEEGSTKKTNLFVEVGFSQQLTRFNLRGDYFGFSRSSGVDVYHLPSYKVTLNSNFNLFGKILLDADLIMLGGMKALDNEKNATADIPSAVDLSLKANYLFSKKVAFFVKGNNLLSNNYQLYLNYPVRGLQGMVGLSCTF